MEAVKKINNTGFDMGNSTKDAKVSRGGHDSGNQSTDIPTIPDVANDGEHINKIWNAGAVGPKEYSGQ